MIDGWAVRYLLMSPFVVDIQATCSILTVLARRALREPAEGRNGASSGRRLSPLRRRSDWLHRRVVCREAGAGVACRAAREVSMLIAAFFGAKLLGRG